MEDDLEALFNLTFDDVCKYIDEHKEEIEEEIEQDRIKEVEAWENARNYWVC